MSNPFGSLVDGIAASAGAMKKPRKAIRLDTDIGGKDSPGWDALVDRLLGPVVVESDRERRRSNALALAAAAMRAAGEKHGEAPAPA